MSAALIVNAWVELLLIDLIQLRGFRAVYQAVSRTPTKEGSLTGTTVSDVVEAVTRACVWYFKGPKCLQRSAAVTRLLRRRGVAAELVVGCHQAPLRGHAWVEVGGDVVSDYIEGLEHFQVLDRW